MSELQTRFIDDTYLEYFKTGKHDLAQVYLKTEADKVIIEKDEKIDELEERIDELQKATDSAWSKVNAMYDELRHHKYKRCLAMAAKYLWKRNYWRDSTPAYERQHQWENMAYKHYKRWLELAEKFKPNNSTAQRAKETNKCLTTTNRTALSAEQ